MTICRGHGPIGLLRIGLQPVLGDLKSTKGTEDIAALLRATFDESELNRGAFGRSIRGVGVSQFALPGTSTPGSMSWHNESPSPWGRAP